MRTAVQSIEEEINAIMRALEILQDYEFDPESNPNSLHVAGSELFHWRTNNMIRSLTMLNEAGDTTISWSENLDDEMEKIIQKKMDEGCTFFIIAERGVRYPLRSGRTRRSGLENALIDALGLEEGQRIHDPSNKPERRVVRQLTHEEQRERWYAYWEETKGEWMEAMVAFVIGYRNLPIFKKAGAL